MIPRTAAGVGLRAAHYAHVLEHRPAVDFFEVIAENFLDGASRSRAVLKEVATIAPVVIHGVGLNLLGTTPIRDAHLDALRELADAVDAPYVTEHLCWSADARAVHHDLLPVPYTDDVLDYAVARVRYVAARLGRPFGVENLSSYVAFSESTMTEWDFYTRVVERSRCHFMLDVNNVHVSARNHGFEARSYLSAIDMERVLQVHVAGHDDTDPGVVVDTHDRDVPPAVLELLAGLYRERGPFPILLERDDALPPFPDLLAELARIKDACGGRA